MKTLSSFTKSGTSGVLAAFLASLCCITPFFAFLAGISGIATTFTWLEPFRPYLIVLTIGILGFEWYQKLKPKTAEEIQCACDEDEKPSFWQSKRFLSVITVFAVLMLAFPNYAKVFYPKNNNQNASFNIGQDTTKTHKVVLDVKGMTCSGCESHIKYEVGKLEGVKSVEASYTSGTASVEFLTSKLKKSDIIDVINQTGYTVIESKKQSITSTEMSDNISFYKVPLVCNAVPTIGCGSRSKPILQDFENAEGINEAWLNRAGTVIAIVWNDRNDFEARRNLINAVFTKHQVNASEVLMNDYATNYDSFNKRDGWLRNADVDKLSKEEAEIIAEQILGVIKKTNKLSSTNEEKLRVKIFDTFYDFFLNYKSLEELEDPKVYLAKLGEIFDFGEELLGKGAMPSVDELWNACSAASASCNHEGCSGSSCKVRK